MPSPYHLIDAVFGGKVSARLLELLQTATAQRWSATEDFVDGIELLGAQAAFAAAEEAGSLDDVEDELFRFARIIDNAPDLRYALGDSALPVDAKQALIRSLLADKVAPMTLLLVDTVVAAPRGRPVDRAVDGLATAAAARRQREIAVVTSAIAPHRRPARPAHCGARSRSRSGRRLQTRIDPSIEVASSSASASSCSTARYACALPRPAPDSPASPVQTLT